MTSTNSTTSNNSVEPNANTGRYHSVKGTLVESIGNLTGAQSWVDSGKQEHLQGEGEIKAAQIQGYAEGTKDVLEGKKDSVVGALFGDKSQQVSGNAQLEKGQAQQSLNDPTK